MEKSVEIRQIKISPVLLSSKNNHERISSMQSLKLQSLHLNDSLVLSPQNLLTSSTIKAPFNPADKQTN